MFRKKSLDASLAGLIVRACSVGGAFKVYDVRLGCGGAGCRARYAGIRTRKRAHAIGRTESRYGSKQTNVQIARRESV